MLQLFPPLFMEAHFSPLAWNIREVLGIRKMKGRQTKGQVSTCIYLCLECVGKILSLTLDPGVKFDFFLYFCFLKFCIK